MGNNMIKFEKTNKDLTIIVQTNAVHLHDILENFEDFLRGCGFVIDGHIDVIEDKKDDAI